MPARSLSSSFPAWPTNGSPACPRGSREPRRRTSGRRPGCRRRRRPACGPAASGQRVQGPTASSLSSSARPGPRSRPEFTPADASVAAAARAAAAAAPAAPAGKLGWEAPGRRRPRTALPPSWPTVGTGEVLVAAHELLEVRLTLHADVLVDRHDRKHTHGGPSCAGIRPRTARAARRASPRTRCRRQARAGARARPQRPSGTSSRQNDPDHRAGRRSRAPPAAPP